MSELFGELIRYVIVPSLAFATVAYGLLFAVDMVDEWIDGRRGR